MIKSISTGTAGDSLRRAAIAIVVLHAFVTAAHSAAHMNLKILMNTWQNAYIFSVIVLAPFIALYLIWKRRRGGYLILFLSMFGALVFGGYYHFIAAGADNVAVVGHHATARLFQVSAVLIALVEFAGVVAGVMGLRASKS